MGPEAMPFLDEYDKSDRFRTESSLPSFGLMDDVEDDARYPPNPYNVNHQRGYGSLPHPKFLVKNGTNSRLVINQSIDEDVDNDDEENDDEDDDGDDDNKVNKRVNDTELERKHPKKRRLRTLVSSYEFAPRVSAPLMVGPGAPKQVFGGRNSLMDWTEHETLVLLDAWGDRFLQRGRKSLRSEEWQEVAEKVSDVSKVERTETQCRNRLDTLKKKYKKETSKSTGQWVYFKKMDFLLSTPLPLTQGGLGCGFDSGEYVFMNPRAYLNSANGADEMRDSPANSDESADDELDGFLPEKRSLVNNTNGESSFGLLADSIRNFSRTYEKIENGKRRQMLELEKMRMDFHKELEVEKRQIVEKAQAEISKLLQGDDEENDT